MLTKTLEMALIRAIREAKTQKHEYVTVEHMLYGLLDDELTNYIISECGGSIEGLKEKLEDFLAVQVPKATAADTDEPLTDLGL